MTARIGAGVVAAKNRGTGAGTNRAIGSVIIGGQMLALLPLFAFWANAHGGFLAGVLTIGFIYGAYMTEVFRGAIQSIPKGQAEAARAYGLGGWRLQLGSRAYRCLVSARARVDSRQLLAAIAQVFQFDLCKGAALARLDMVDLDRSPKTPIVFNDRPGFDFVSVYLRHCGKTLSKG